MFDADVLEGSRKFPSVFSPEVKVLKATAAAFC